MAHPIINSDTADRLFSALCNTLLHSLWQGILLAAIAGIVITSTRKSTSTLRYNLLVSALLVFTIGVEITFVLQYQKSEITGMAVTSAQNIYSPAVNYSAPSVTVHPIQADAPQAKPSFTVQLDNYLTDHHNTIVLIWFLIVCARSLQLAFGLYATRRLRRVGVLETAGRWPQRMKQLADQLGIARTVTLLESTLAKVPMVIGHLKPVILVPIGLLTALSAEEVEAILVHELAHIRRRDYLVNMLQSLVEIVLFFNPAVLWVSKLIKTERENCCDDLAVAQNNNKLSYIRALVSCEEYRASVPAYAMGLPGSKNSLLHRVQRMANNRNYSLNLFEKTILAVCLVALGLGVSAFTAREHIAKALKSVAAVIHHDNKTTESKAKAITVKNDTIVKKQAAHPNDVSVLTGKMQQRSVLTDTIKNGDRKALNLLKNKIDSPSANPDKFNLADQFTFKKGDSDFFKSPDMFKSVNFKLGKPDTNFFKWKTFKYKPFQEMTRALYRERIITDTNHVNISLNEKEMIVNGVRMSKEVHDRMYKKYGTSGSSGTYNSNYSDNKNSGYAYRSSADGYQRQGDEQKKYWTGQQQRIIKEMSQDGLISDNKNITFTLTDKTFVINGMVQNGEVFQKYHQEYVPTDAGDNWTWNYTGPGSFPTNRYYGRDWDAYARQNAAEGQRIEAERDKKFVADLLEDGLITDPKNVSFSMSDKKLIVNGKKQSDEVYQKYKDKYMHDNQGTSWTWNYSNHE